MSWYAASFWMDWTLFLLALAGIFSCAERRNAPAAVAYVCLAIAMARLLMMRLA